MIVVIDYGMGNLGSVAKGLEKVGCQVKVTSRATDIIQAKALVLPGVGAFADAIDHLKQFDLVTAIIESIEQGKPFLGICLGLQLLFDKSYEGGEHRGLGIFSGEVRHLPEGVKVPHMGWNQVHICKSSEILDSISEGENFYFVHSYVVVPRDDSIILTTTNYGADFVSSIAKGNVWAFQFHPEKSSIMGLRILENFAKICQKVE